MSATSDSEESSINGPLDAQGDDGWQDLEPDVEEQQIVCLFCPVKQDDVSAFLSHCQQTHNFDFLSVRNKFGVCTSTKRILLPLTITPPQISILLAL